MHDASVHAALSVALAAIVQAAKVLPRGSGARKALVLSARELLTELEAAV